MSDVNEQDLDELEEEEDAEELGEDEEIDAEEFDADLESVLDDDDDLKVADAELSPKEQNAKSLAIRRAIEQRMERKLLDEDLDYLELDPDD